MTCSLFAPHLVGSFKDFALAADWITAAKINKKVEDHTDPQPHDCDIQFLVVQDLVLAEISYDADW